MWLEFFKFDLRYQFRQPLLWVSAAFLSAIAFLAASSESFQLGGAVGNVLMNAPVVIANQLSVLSMIAMFLVTSFIAGTILRDSEVGIADMLFATPMRKIDYLSGRFLAGFITCLAIFVLITLAMMAGSSMPSIDAARIGPFALQPYAWSFMVFVVPNLLFVAALLLLLAATTRSLILVYAGALAFLVLWSMAGLLQTGGGDSSLAVLLDPFGVRALSQATRYFSSAQSNTVLPELTGLLLANRLIWSSMALALFAASVLFFKPQRAGSGRSWFVKVRAAFSMPAPAKSAPAESATALVARRIAPRFGRASVWSQWWSLLCFDTKGVLKSLPFLVMLLLAIANFFANYTIGGMRFDSTPYPLTRLLMEELSGGMYFVLLIVLVFYSGELIFKDRQCRIAAVSDALPVPNWVPLLAKAGALVAVILVFMLAGVVAAVGIQLFVGGAPFEGLLYLQSVLLGSIYFILMAIGIVALQVLANNKYIGSLLGIALVLSETVLKGMDLDHRLLNFASLPPLIYSDMNGYGHFLTGWSWFALYWALCGVALLILAQAFWVRGLAAGWPARCILALRNLRGPAGLALALSLAAFGATGGWIFYNTNIVNRYQSSATSLDARADYERRFREYLSLPNLSITAVRADVDIFPDQRSVAIKGRYGLQNKTSAGIDTLFIQADATVRTQLGQLPPHQVVQVDADLGVRIIKLETAIAPGATLDFDFTVDVSHPGFTSSGAPDTIQHNGTLFASENFFPKFGYVQASEIEDRNERRARGLGEPQRMPRLEDRDAHFSNFWKLWGFDAGLIDFETTVSTSADQIAIAPGRLVGQWDKEGRRYFHYKMDTPILPFFSYQSARWEVRTGTWRGLPIEVYHDKKHAYNLDSMLVGAQKALDYLADEFGPYPHRQVRILEFPLYQHYARSFPNTIPFSESLGFINDLRDPRGVDHVFYVTAHELAHQWWGDQVIAANIQGSGMVTESLAEYSALMVFEKQFGTEKTRRILRYDLDQYLTGRGKELIEEQPLVRAENQVYIQYRKGSLVFYRLREEIGEAAVNRALKRLLATHRYQTAPYVTSLDVLRYIRAEAPPEKQDLITDLFERIVFYDNRALAASARARPDGRWDVTMTLQLAKTEADGKGKETVRDYDEPVEIAIFARAPQGSKDQERVLWREKRRLPSGLSTLTITVSEQPYEVGVDPDNLLIDRVAGDNRKKVESPVLRP